MFLSNLNLKDRFSKSNLLTQLDLDILIVTYQLVTLTQFSKPSKLEGGEMICHELRRGGQLVDMADTRVTNGRLFHFPRATPTLPNAYVSTFYF